MEILNTGSPKTVLTVFVSGYQFFSDMFNFVRFC